MGVYPFPGFLPLHPSEHARMTPVRRAFLHWTPWSPRRMSKSRLDPATACVTKREM
jgi:hypothetical protein